MHIIHAMEPIDDEMDEESLVDGYTNALTKHDPNIVHVLHST
jgi:hypothetical protein